MHDIHNNEKSGKKGSVGSKFGLGPIETKELYHS